MAFISIPLSVKVAMEFIRGGVRIILTFHFTKSTAWVIGDMQTLATNMRDWWINQYKVIQPTDIALSRITVTDLSTQFGLYHELNIDPTIPGLVASPSLPGNATLAVTLLTAQRGRSFRGRSYVPLLDELHTGGDVVTATHVTSILTVYAALVTQLQTSMPTVTWVVASRFANHQPRVTGIVTPIIAFKSDSVVDSQRRRLTGRGK